MKRYELNISRFNTRPVMCGDMDGSWVRWTDAKAEIERLEGVAWQCWKRDTMTKQEAEVLIGVPSIRWDEAAAAAESEKSDA